MSDLISRQAAIEAINEIIRMEHSLRPKVYVAKDAIKKLPSAQIHCKDCRYWDTSWQNDYAPDYHYCPMIDETRRSDFYCADAERKVTE